METRGLGRRCELAGWGELLNWRATPRGLAFLGLGGSLVTPSTCSRAFRPSRGIPADLGWSSLD